MDTRLEALFAACMTGDTRPMLKAIHDYHCSWHPADWCRAERLPWCRRSSRFRPALDIPALRPLVTKQATVKYHAVTVAPWIPVLDWFDRRLTPDGLVGGFYYWPYFDWVKGLGRGYAARFAGQARDGVQPVVRISAEDRRRTGGTGRIRASRRRVPRTCRRGQLRHPPPLAGTERAASSATARNAGHQRASASVGDPQRRRFGGTAVRPGAGLPGGQVAFTDEQGHAVLPVPRVEEGGLYHRAYELFDQWIGLADLHVTTWPEDPIHGRSDCHGWGSVPIYEFVAETLGIQPAKPGFEAVRIAPQPGPLAWANGTVATRRGDVRVSWEIVDGACKVHASGPHETRMIVVLPGGRTVEGVGEITAA